MVVLRQHQQSRLKCRFQKNCHRQILRVYIGNVHRLVYHMKYSFNGDRIEEYEGNFVPTAITFNVSESGEYTLEEYWTPRTGTNYEKDVRNKFPGDSADNALNSEKFAEDLIKKNWRLANEYFSQTKSS